MISRLKNYCYSVGLQLFSNHAKALRNYWAGCPLSLSPLLSATAPRSQLFPRAYLPAAHREQ